MQFGESLRIVGNHAMLGDWEPQRGWKLTTNEDIVPCWVTAEPILVDSFFEVKYKYVVVGQDGALSRWEDHEGNRSVIAMGADMTVEDDDGFYRQFSAAGQDDKEDETAALIEPVVAIKTPEMRRMMFEHKMGMVAELEGNFRIGTHDTVFMVSLSLPIKLVKGEKGEWMMEEKPPTDGRNFAWLPLIQEYRQKTKRRVVCVGWPGVHVPPGKEQGEIERLLAKSDYIPVFPPKQDFERYVNFCTTFLWPVFHDVMMFFQASNPLAFDEQGWAAYQHINNIYAAAVVPHTHESDLIWIHDYHLLMTSTFISRKLVKANIGFYLHSPFPSSDSFKSLPIREELLSGMLCADQLGFQFFAYARNFLISVKRICGHDPSYKAGGFFGLECNGRHIMIRVAHFVYPFVDTKKVVHTKVVEDKTQLVRQLFKDKIVFCSMDRCDNLSGLLPKFRAFRRFLAANSQYKGKAVLVQYTFDTSVKGDAASSLMQTLREKADGFLTGTADGKIQLVLKDGKAFNDCDIFLRVEEVSREDRLGLFRAAHIFLDTSVKAGLNLMPFEFITAHSDETAEKKSVAIVSEFSGCSRVLLGSIRVNPWNTADLVKSLRRAIELPLAEREEMYGCNLTYVAKSSGVEWFRDFLEDLRRNKKKEGMRFEAVGFGAKIRHIAMTQNFQKLNTDHVVAAYRSAKNRLILFDNEGTLAADTRNLFREYGAPKGDVWDLKSHGTAPNEAVLECLRTLCQDPRNTVVILSGRNREMMDEWFGSVPKIGLAAERGFYYRLPALGQQWFCLKSNQDNTWQSYAFEIMRLFMRRTQGSFIEHKGSALVWQYRDADQHFGSWQAKELSNNLKELLFGFDVEVLAGKGYVEVNSRGVNKGVASAKVLAKVEQMYGNVDFVLCIGDDRSDESMFEAMASHFGIDEEEMHSSSISTTDDGSDRAPSDDNRTSARPPVGEGSPLAQSTPRGFDTVGSLGMVTKHRRGPSGLSLPGKSSSDSFGRASSDLPRTISAGSRNRLSLGGESSGGLEELLGPVSGQRVYTCTVGRKPSAAKFYLDDVDEVSDLLSSLKSQHERRTTSQHSSSNYNTWSGGDGQKVGVRPMPSLSSIDYGARPNS